MASRFDSGSSIKNSFAVIALLIVAGTGTYVALVYNTTVTAYEYRETIGPWFRSLFMLQPRYQLMEGTPYVFKMHVVFAFGLFASIYPACSFLQSAGWLSGKSTAAINHTRFSMTLKRKDRSYQLSDFYNIFTLLFHNCARLQYKLL
ncbi:respiratory nitrate reductase subunit gamma [Lentibacillus kimchii]